MAIHSDPPMKTNLGKPTVIDDTKDDEALIIALLKCFVSWLKGCKVHGDTLLPISLPITFQAKNY